MQFLYKDCRILLEGSSKTTDYVCKKSKDSLAVINLEGHKGYFEGKACLKHKGIVSIIVGL